MIRHSWRTQLKSATTEREVLSVARAFLAEWPKAEIDSLPVRAWPARVATRDDLLSHAVTLAQLHARFDGAAASLPGLQELLLFFTHAAVRIAKLSAAAQAHDCPARPRTRPLPSRKSARPRTAGSG